VSPNSSLPFFSTPIIIPCSLFTAGTMIGFDASGHIAEETRNARYAEFFLALPNLSLTR